MKTLKLNEKFILEDETRHVAEIVKSRLNFYGIDIDGYISYNNKLLIKGFEDEKRRN